MIRTNLHLPKDYIDRLRLLSKEKGVSVAELVRRAVAELLVREEMARKRSR